MSGSELGSSDSDASRGPAILGICAGSALLAMVCLAVRLYTRFRVVKAPGIDDLVLTFTMFGLIVPQEISTCMAVKYGLGRHMRYLSEHEMLMMRKWLAIGEPFVAVVCSVPKIAVVVFLHKCFRRTHRPSIYVLYIMVIFLIALSATNSLIWLLQCRPLHAMWVVDVEKTCYSPRISWHFGLSVRALSAFTDLVLALYPLVFVSQMRMRLKKKMAVCCVMGLGVLACVWATARVIILRTASPEDLTWDVTTMVIVSNLEAHVIMICASIPAIVPLFLVKKRLRQDLSEESEDCLSDLADDLDILSRHDHKIDDEGLGMVAAAEARDLQGNPSASRIMTIMRDSTEHDKP